MAFFQYRAADQAGKVIDGVMEADAERSVIMRLREMGFIPLRIAAPSERAIEGGGDLFGMLGRPVVHIAEVIFIRCREALGRSSRALCLVHNEPRTASAGGTERQSAATGQGQGAERQNGERCSKSADPHVPALPTVPRQWLSE